MRSKNKEFLELGLKVPYKNTCRHYGRLSFYKITVDKNIEAQNH